MVKRMKNYYRPPAIIKAIQLIEYLAKNTPSTLSELVRELQLSPSSLHGILHTLLEANWLQNDRQKRFSLGPGLRDLVNSVAQQYDIIQISRPIMEVLADELGESVFLGRKENDKLVIEECIEGYKEMRIGARSGVRLPLMAGALGKVFLAETMNNDQIHTLLRKTNLPEFTENSITDPDVFVSELEKTRNQGYAIDDEEYLRGVRAIAAPVFYHKNIVAVLYIAGFSYHLNDNNMQAIKKELLKATKIISKLISNLTTS